jgi:tetratricopeptide (TPR) repeat protein
LGPREVSADKLDAFEHARSRTLHWLPGFPVVLAGFAVGLILWLADRRAARQRELVTDEAARSRGAVVGLMLWFMLVYSASLAPFVATGRLRVPYIPLLLLFAAYGLWRLRQLAAARRRRAALVVVAGWAAAWGLASIALVPYKPDLATWYLDRAAAYLQKGALEPAIAEYQAAVLACPDNPAPYAVLATALLKKGDVDGALATYRRAIQAVPQAVALRRSLATLLREKNQLDEAMAQYRAVLDISPTDAETWCQLGSALEAKGATTEALSAYQRALDIDPTLSQAGISASALLQKRGDLAGAIAAYRQAIESNPNLFEAHYNLAAALRAQGDLEGAYREVATALHIRPRHPTAVSLLKYLQQERLRAGTRPAESRPATRPSEHP